MANETNCSNDTNLSNCSNVTEFVCTRSLASCTNEVRQEAKLACKEYEGIAGGTINVVSDQNCKFWQDYASQECLRTCADCEQIAKQIYNSCLFLLQTVMSFTQARPHCIRTERDFLLYRCPSATIDKINNCYTEEYERCNALCGNYNYAPGVQRYGCECTKIRAQAGYPDQCLGQTVLDGFVAGSPGLRHSCRLVPDDCKNHRPTTCGFYKHCPVDACVVLNVSCPKLDTCQSDGVCASSDAQCYYQPRADGESCDDGLAWTHTDICTNGQCRGIPNKCMRDRVNCSTTNPCLRVTDKVLGGCDPGTGSCVFDVLPDGTSCSSRASGGTGVVADDGWCSSGLCRRDRGPFDDCRNTTCQRPSQCHEVPLCHPGRGCAVAALLPEGAPCDDGDASTHGDRCIEGRCLGDPVATPKFQELGGCAGRPPEAGGLLLPWRRYSADVPDLQDCKTQCGSDPECSAFSYGYQSCSIFGTSRLKNPDEALWGRSWQLETAPAQPQYDVDCYAKGADPWWSSLTTSERTLLMLSVSFVLLLPVAWFIFVGRHALRASLLRLLGGHEESSDMWANSPPSPGGSGSAKVAAAPVPEYMAALPDAGGGSAQLVHVPDPRGEVQPADAR